MITTVANRHASCKMSRINRTQDLVQAPDHAQPASPFPVRIRRIASLDGLRTFSLLLVLLGHVNLTQNYPRSVITEELSRFSHFGVQIFFVISGYLITLLLVREKEATGRVNFVDFYRRRCFRILPASLVYTTITAIILLWTHAPLSRKCLVAAYTFSMGYLNQTEGIWQMGHLWSLGAEEQFYLLWPLALLLLPRRLTISAWVAMFLSAAARQWMFVHDVGSLDYAFPAVADCMAAGCLLALYTPRLASLPTWIYSLPVCLFIVALAVVGSIVIHDRGVRWWGLEPLIIAAMVHILINREDWILNNRPITYVGTLSYALYLTQQAFLNRYSHHSFNAFPLNLVFAASAALALHYGVERPMLALGKRFSARGSQPPSAPQVEQSSVLVA